MKCLELQSEMVICLNSAMVEKQVIRRRYRTGSKWSVTKAEYENYVYPNFCSGPGTAYTRRAAEKLLKTSELTRSFVLEDVYINGILRRKAKIELYHMLTVPVPSLSWQKVKIDYLELKKS